MHKHTCIYCKRSWRCKRIGVLTEEFQRHSWKTCSKDRNANPCNLCIVKVCNKMDIEELVKLMSKKKRYRKKK